MSSVQIIQPATTTTTTTTPTSQALSIQDVKSKLSADSTPQRIDIRFPTAGHPDLSQDEEWCDVVDRDDDDNATKTTRFRFHDYARVFSRPGLYDQLFGGPGSETKCVSPQVLTSLVGQHIPRVLARMDGRGGHHTVTAPAATVHGRLHKHTQVQRASTKPDTMRCRLEMLVLRRWRLPSRWWRRVGWWCSMSRLRCGKMLARSKGNLPGS
ncbi:hypothetical protein BD289DRAFT_184543 [Coniella lustricola]|uniref:Uncharacterized protein n=1 Tax=Coniella lustricola TaxID=2025994 RepID=A0A2T3ADD6_9PEZI|nr:hypothetical protein BD289DRAFT_184543 [Coniella lustricola]